MSTNNRQTFFFLETMREAGNVIVRQMQRNQREHRAFTRHTSETRRDYNTTQAALQRELNEIRAIESAGNRFMNLMILADLPDEFKNSSTGVLIKGDGLLVAAPANGPSAAPPGFVAVPLGDLGELFGGDRGSAGVSLVEMLLSGLGGALFGAGPGGDDDDDAGNPIYFILSKL
ncbi:MAG: hypothetical protein RJB39_386 [Candidatus Parcubacteria bacterium]|jgi:hypothetical protein